MNDNDIINDLSNRKQIKWNFLDNNIKQYLLNRYDDNYSTEKTDILRESYYRILNNIDVCPICPICGKKRKFNSNKYLKTCGSKKCLANECQKRREETNLKRYGCISIFGDKEIQEKAKQAMIEKYGVDNPWKLKEIQDKCKNTVIQNNGGLGAASEKIKTKMKQTNLIKYGYEHNWQDPEEQKRSHSKEAKEKQKQTCLQKYGVEYSGQAEIKKIRTKETCIKHFGVEYSSQAETVKQKQQETKRKNHTFNTSIPEKKTYELLKEKFHDIIYQYKSEQYPFMCDFYIPSINLYIECNYHWTHGGHKYIGDENDIKQVENWKSKNSKFYNNAIYTLTIRDTHKRNIAKQNNLNYIEFWNINEVKEWLNKNERKTI